MALAITHSTVATLPDETGAEVNKDEWNDDHVIAGGTAGSILYVSSTGTITEDNTNLKWGTTAGQGLTANAGTAASAVSALSITQTWNYATAAITGVKWTFTDTSSHANTLAFEILGGAAGATKLFQLTKDGQVRAADGAFGTGGFAFTGSNAYGMTKSGSALIFGAGSEGFRLTVSVLRLATGGVYAVGDTIGLSRISDGVLGVGTGAAGNSAGTIQCKHNSSDGSAGVSGTGTTITCKDGIITAIS